MGLLTGREPSHWHDGAGNHRMKDPFQPGVRAKDLSSDEVNYAAHLEAHKDAARSTDPRPNDSAVVRNLLALVEDNRKSELILFEMIHLLRVRDAKEADG